MQKVLFVNRNQTGEGEAINSFDVIGGVQSTASNEGLPGSVIATAEGLKVGLIHREGIPLGPAMEVAGPIEMEGQFAVEINGKFVPHYFTAENLPKYFDEKNQSGTGIEITLDADIPPIP